MCVSPSVSRRLPLVYHPHYSCSWPPKHRFPMSKFADLHAFLLTQPSVLATASWHQPELPPHAWVEAVHEREYYRAFLGSRLGDAEARRIGFREQLSRPELIRRTRLEVGGTVLTAKLALRHGLACNLAGGTHHAHAGTCSTTPRRAVARPPAVTPRRRGVQAPAPASPSSTTSRWPPPMCASTRACRAWLSSTSTSTRATAPPRSSRATARSSRCRCTAAPTSPSARRALTSTSTCPRVCLRRGRPQRFLAPPHSCRRE